MIAGVEVGFGVNHLNFYGVWKLILAKFYEDRSRALFCLLIFQIRV